MLDTISTPAPDRLTSRLIKRQVAQKHGLTVEDIDSPSRRKLVVRARQEAMFRIKRELSHGRRRAVSLTWVGRQFGEKPRHHATVLHAVRSHEARLEKATQ